MNFIVALFIFVIILFLYIHISDQYKKSEDLEIYDMDYVSNSHLQTICNLKQPFIFGFVIEDLLNISQRLKGNHDIKLWDNSNDPIYLPIESAVALFQSNSSTSSDDVSKNKYFTERNQDFLEDVDLLSDIRELDAFLKPDFCAHSKYELIMGSAGAEMPLRYHLDDRNFVFLISGKITVKMTPWRNRKYMDPIDDFENYDFYSKSSIHKECEFLEFVVESGHVLYIPPFWWHSIKIEYADTVAIGIHYKTVANVIACLPSLTRYYLQLSSTKVIPVRKLEIDSSHQHDSSHQPDSSHQTDSNLVTSSDSPI